VAQALAQDEAEAIQRQVIEAAKGGNLKAAELILARIWPPRRGRPLRLKLPAPRTAAEVSDGMAAVVDAMAAGMPDWALVASLLWALEQHPGSEMTPG
jgi:hypothetical protein